MRPPVAGENTGAAPSPISAPHAASPLHPEPALGSGELLPTRSRFAAVPGITHYLPQANVARDGQSERQCNVLHRLSHGSVQKPANTEVPPPADPAATGAREGGYGNPAGPRPPGRRETRFRSARSPGALRSAFFSFKKKQQQNFLLFGNCMAPESERDGDLLQQWGVFKL